MGRRKGMSNRGRTTADDNSASFEVYSPGLLPHLYDCAERIKFVYGKTKDEIAKQIRERLEADIRHRPDGSGLGKLRTEELIQSNGGAGPIYDQAQRYIDGLDGDIEEFRSLVANADLLSMEALRKARKKARISQKQMADAIGISTSTISHFENGCGSLTVGQAVGYASMCGMTIEDAIGTANDDEMMLLNLYRKAPKMAKAAIIESARGISDSHALDGSWYNIPGIPRCKVIQFIIENSSWEPVDGGNL